MNKIFTMVAMTLTITYNAIAQTVTGHFYLGNPQTVALSMPKEFAFDNTPLIFLYDNTNSSYDNTKENNLLIYDENLNLKKTIHLQGDKTFDYQLTYQDQERDAYVDEKRREQFREYGSYEEFIQNMKTNTPSFSESSLIVKEQENGDRIISIDWSNSYSQYNFQFFFAYKYFGTKYPKTYFVWHKDGIVTGYNASYAVTYSEWKTVGTHVENRQEPLGRLRLCNINLNNGDGRNDYFFEVSQTLFNKDEKFEYIIPKYKLSSNGKRPTDGEDVTIPWDPYQDENIVTTQTVVISEDKYLALTGFQVVSENGDIIKDLNFDSGFEGYIEDSYAFVITIGSNTYLAFDGSSDGNDATVFYKIDKTSTDIKQVMKAPASMKLFPSVTDRGTPINISFGDDNPSGSEIVVVSANGTEVKKQAIPAGETSTQMLIPSGTGIYCVSRIQNNKVTDTRKIIVK